MNRTKISLVVLALALSLLQCTPSGNRNYKQEASAPELVHLCADHLTDEIVWDIFKPPVASRIYAYSFLGAYEVLIKDHPEYRSLAGKLNGFTAIPEPEKNKTYCFPLAGMVAFNTIGKSFTLSVEKWQKFEDGFYKKYEQMDIPEDVYARSVEYGTQVARHIINYANGDNYKTTRNFHYTVANRTGSWIPTPPSYAQACEPQWNQIRSFTLDSASQFTPPPPVPYDMTEGSPFYKLVTEVYDYGQNPTKEQRAIAYFWDDNPLVTETVGHIMATERKMTPPGHWIAIARTVAQNQKADMMKSVEAYTLSAIALYDAFIACWDEKYRSGRIRPVTVIQKHFDQDWMPYLETPPFPEYVSGHSSISAAAGKILAHIYGDNISFTDSTEHKFGHGVRSFKSFKDAYWEVSLSRVYGGIHFMDAVAEGTSQGEQIGEWIWKKLKKQE